MTGAASGLGLEIAHIFKKLGAEVAMLERDQDLLKAKLIR